MDKKPIIEFSDILASSDPTPGGGGASALCACMAASLSQMVTNLTKGKKKYAEYEDELQKATKELDKLRKQFLELINEDRDAFLPLAEAYKMPKDTPNYDKILEDCLRKAAFVPFKVLEYTCILIMKNYRLATIGSKLAISDAATAAAIAGGCLKAAAMNVTVNTRLMKDREFATFVDNKVDELVKEYSVIADSTYEKVLTRLQNG